MNEINERERWKISNVWGSVKQLIVSFWRFFACGFYGLSAATNEITRSRIRIENIDNDSVVQSGWKLSLACMIMISKAICRLTAKRSKTPNGLSAMWIIGNSRNCFFKLWNDQSANAFSSQDITHSDSIVAFNKTPKRDKPTSGIRITGLNLSNSNKFVAD